MSADDLEQYEAEIEHQLFQDGLTEVEAADKAGFSTVWLTEHHFLEEYCHSSAPEMFLAAASQRTRQIRLGHGILQLTTNHPARVAEQVAVLDLLSNGRCEFGMGESASDTELEPFKVPFQEKRAIFEEAVQAIIPAFRDGGHEHHGKYFDFPLRNILPKPLQKPCGSATRFTSAKLAGTATANLSAPSPTKAVAGGPWRKRPNIKTNCSALCCSARGASVPI
mgnify:CR=1 FL=1